MTASMPKTIRIGTVIFKVTDDPDEWMRKEHEEQNKRMIGRTDTRETTIYICPNLSIEMKRTVLWHEVLHALCAVVMGMPRWSSKAMGTTAFDREEFVVSAWEYPTLSVLRDNPSLADFLLDN